MGPGIAAEDMGVGTTNTALSSLAMAASQNSSSPVSFKNYVLVLLPPSWISITTLTADRKSVVSVVKY